VVFEHYGFKKAWKGGADFPPYEAMIEIKLIWPGWGRKFHEKGVREDIKKLEACVATGITKNAIFVLLDSLDRKGIPYFNKEDLIELKKGFKGGYISLVDSKNEVTAIKEAEFQRY
jgi:hypothetical protein